MCVCVCVCVCVYLCMKKKQTVLLFVFVSFFFCSFFCSFLSLSKFIKPYRKYPRPENVTHFPIASKKLSFYVHKIMSCLSSSFVSSVAPAAFHARSSSVAGCSVVVPQTVRRSRGGLFFLSFFFLSYYYYVFGCARFSTLRRRTNVFG